METVTITESLGLILYRIGTTVAAASYAGPVLWENLDDTGNKHNRFCLHIILLHLIGLTPLRN